MRKFTTFNNQFPFVDSFLGVKAIFLRSWILMFSTRSFIRLSISRDLSIEMSPVGRLLSSKLYGVGFLDIKDIKRIKKEDPNIMKKFQFQLRWSYLILSEKLLQLDWSP